MEDDAVGYSGSNSGGNLIIENSVFRGNRAGIVPNSENPGDPPPPSNGACDPVKPYKAGHRKLPTFESTDIQHCTIYRDNLVEDNNNLTAPTNSSTAIAPWGVGVEFPGVYGDAVEGNTIKGNANDGFLGFEYPNPYPPEEDTILFGFSGVKVADNTFEENGGSGGPYARDIMFQGGVFTSSLNDCAIGNTTPDGTRYRRTSKANGACDNAHDAQPQRREKARWDGWNSSPTNPRRCRANAQPAPGAQENDAQPVRRGVPTNPLYE